MNNKTGSSEEIEGLDHSDTKMCKARNEECVDKKDETDFEEDEVENYKHEETTPPRKKHRGSCQKTNLIDETSDDNVDSDAKAAADDSDAEELEEDVNILATTRDKSQNEMIEETGVEVKTASSSSRRNMSIQSFENRNFDIKMRPSRKRRRSEDVDGRRIRSNLFGADRRSPEQELAMLIKQMKSLRSEQKEVEIKAVINKAKEIVRTKASLAERLCKALSKELYARAGMDFRGRHPILRIAWELYKSSEIRSAASEYGSHFLKAIMEDLCELRCRRRESTPDSFERRLKKWAERWSRRRLSSDMEAHLGNMEESDRPLQQLLWSLGVQVDLLAHQPEAIRFCIGIRDSWPKQFPPTNPPMLQQGKSGGILADEMGLGKTWETTCAIVVRNFITKVRGEKVLPTMIVAPNDGVLSQWVTTLQRAGLRAEDVINLRDRNNKSHDPFAKSNANRKTPMVILLTRYTIQAEVRHTFKHVSLKKDPSEVKVAPRSRYFSHVTDDFIERLDACRRFAKAQSKDLQDVYDSIIDEMWLDGRCKHRKELGPFDALREQFQLILRKRFHGNSAAFHFETLIIDEGHLLKNPISFWSIGVALLGCVSKRVLSLTATPFVNRAEDFATPMSWFDPGSPFAARDYWQRLETKLKVEDVESKNNHLGEPKDSPPVQDWLQKYFLRRKKEVVLKNLPKKKIIIEEVELRPDELDSYGLKEYLLKQSLQELVEALKRGGNTFEARRHRNECLQKFFSLTMSCITLTSHPGILYEKRFGTICFSSARQTLNVGLKKKCCVCGVKEREKREGQIREMPEGKQEERRWVDEEHHLDLGDNEDDRAFSENLITVRPKRASRDKSDEVKLFEVPSLHCEAKSRFGGRSNHFVCERHNKPSSYCNNKDKCRMCADMIGSLSMGPDHMTRPDSVRRESKLSFVPSTKILKVVELTKRHSEERVIIFSHFTCMLDLIEATLEAGGIRCSRYDGNDRKKSEALRSFKKSKNKCLLCTPQSGGVGLNITECSVVIFTDRWFNPVRHEQAESRCHRIGQKKDVTVYYIDAENTWDKALRQIHKAKSELASKITGLCELKSSSNGPLDADALSGLSELMTPSNGPLDADTIKSLLPILKDIRNTRRIRNILSESSQHLLNRITSFLRSTLNDDNRAVEAIADAFLSLELDSNTNEYKLWTRENNLGRKSARIRRHLKACLIKKNAKWFLERKTHFQGEEDGPTLRERLRHLLSLPELEEALERLFNSRFNDTIRHHSNSQDQKESTPAPEPPVIQNPVNEKTETFECPNPYCAHRSDGVPKKYDLVQLVKMIGPDKHFRCNAHTCFVCMREWGPEGRALIPSPVK